MLSPIHRSSRVSHHRSDVPTHRTHPMKFVIFLFSICLVTFSSCGFPKIYIGDSQGWATYDKNARRFEIMWERHTHLEECRKDSVKP